MKKQYECLIIINDSLSEAEKKQADERIAQIFSKSQAKILKKTEWGRKKLGYPIKKAKNGIFFIFYIEVDSELVSKLKTLFGYEVCILKNMFFLIEDWAKELNYFEKLKEDPHFNVEKLTKDTTK